MSVLQQRCICQICNCGRHRCPHQPRKPQYACTLSEYQNTYVKTSARPATPCKPLERTLARSGGAEGISTQQQDYTAHKLHPRRVKSATAYRRPPGEMQRATEYSQHFPSYGTGHAAKTINPRRRRSSTAPMETSTEHSRAFTAWPIQTHRPRPCVVVAQNTEPMQQATTSGEAFQKKNVRPATSMKPRETGVNSTEPLQAETTNKAEFGPKPLTERAVKSARFYRSPQMPFEAMTTVQDVYRKHEGAERAKSCKPRTDATFQHHPLDSRTTNNTSYQAWKATRPPPKSPGKYVPPPGEMEKMTTNRHDFQNHGVREPAPTRRPQSRLRTRSEPLLTESTQAADYKQWNVKPERLLRRYERNPPPQSFQGQTEFQASFSGKKAPPAPSLKPAPTVHASGEFQGRTGYQDDYKQKTVPPCPALQLHMLSLSGKQGQRTVQNGLAYSHATQSGHQMYVPLVEQREASQSGKMISLP